MKIPRLDAIKLKDDNINNKNYFYT